MPLLSANFFHGIDSNSLEQIPDKLYVIKVFFGQAFDDFLLAGLLFWWQPFTYTLEPVQC